MDIKLPKLRSPNTSPRMLSSPLQSSAASHRQINIYSMTKPRDSIKLPKLDLMSQPDKVKIVQRLYNEIKIDEESKFENLIQTLQFVDSAKN